MPTHDATLDRIETIGVPRLLRLLNWGVSCGRGPVFKMIGKHETIILQKDFEHGRRYRHLFRSWVGFVESCGANEGQLIFNSWTEKFLVQ